MNPTLSLLCRHRLPSALAGTLLLALLWGALAPLHGPSHERLLTFPARRGADGAPLRTLPLPREVQLTLGVQDVLLLRNRDRVAQVFGPVQLPPGEEFRLPFEEEGDTVFACPAVPGGELTVRVVRSPDPGWARLRWRLGALVDALRTLPLQAPDG